MPYNGLDEMRVMIYSPGRQMLEEYVDANWSSGFTADQVYQTIYGIRYIDDVICRRRDSNLDGDYIDTHDFTHYHITDHQFSTVAILDHTAKLIERITYNAYGMPEHSWPGDVDGDRDQDTTDQSTISNLAALTTPISSSSYKVEADINRDGVIDSRDPPLASGVKLPLQLGRLSDVGNVFGFSGYVYNVETVRGLGSSLGGSGVYTIRFRHYDSGLGRWLQRDPAGYVDGMSSYSLGPGNPLIGGDPMGLSWYGDAWDWFSYHVLQGNNPIHAAIADHVVTPILGDDILINTHPAILYGGGVLVCVVVGVTAYFAAPVVAQGVWFLGNMVADCVLLAYVAVDVFWVQALFMAFNHRAIILLAGGVLWALFGPEYMEGPPGEAEVIAVGLRFAWDIIAGDSDQPTANDALPTKSPYEMFGERVDNLKSAPSGSVWDCHED